MTGRPGIGTVAGRIAHPAAGFTLLELVVVVAVIGTVAFLTVPRLQLPGRDRGLNAAARWLMAHHHKLRVESVRRQRRFHLHCDLDAQRIWATEEGMDAAQQSEAADKALQLGKEARLVLVRMADGREVRAGQSALVYFPDGHSYLAQLLLRDDRGRQRAVRLEPFLPEARLLDADLPFPGIDS